MHSRAVWDVRIIWHDCIIANGTVTTDTSTAAHNGSRADDAIGINQRIISDSRIAVDFGTGIQQNTIPDHCAILNTSILQYHTATAQLNIRADIGIGRNDVRECIAKCFCLLIHLCPELIVSNADHKQAIVFPQFR